MKRASVFVAVEMVRMARWMERISGRVLGVTWKRRQEEMIRGMLVENLYEWGAGLAGRELGRRFRGWRKGNVHV